MKLMKSLLTVAAALLISQNVIASELHFDLHAQDFSEAKKEGDMIWARYELPKSYVTTNLKHTSNYTTLDGSGFLRSELKQPVTTWGVAIDAYYAFDHYSHTRSIILTADNGQSLVIGLAEDERYGSGGGVIFNGTQVYSPSDAERLTIAINKDNAGTVNLNINGRTVATQENVSFPRLRSVETQLITEYGSPDVLNSMIISGDQ